MHVYNIYVLYLHYIMTSDAVRIFEVNISKSMLPRYNLMFSGHPNANDAL